MLFFFVAISIEFKLEVAFYMKLALFFHEIVLWNT